MSSGVFTTITIYATDQRRKQTPTTASTAYVRNVGHPFQLRNCRCTAVTQTTALGLNKLHAYNVNGLTPFHECSSFQSFVLFSIIRRQLLYILCTLIVNEVNDVQDRSACDVYSSYFPVAPPLSGYSRLGPVACIINVVMVTLYIATYITYSRMSFLSDPGDWYGFLI